MNRTVYKLRIKKGDTVMVRSGKYKGRTGKVTAVYPKQNKLIIEGVNVAKKHRKPTAQNPQGGIFDIERPIDVSKVGLLDAVAKKPSKVGYLINKSGQKVRILKTTGKEIK